MALIASACVLWLENCGDGRSAGGAGGCGDVVDAHGHSGIFATGLFNAWHHLGSPDALLGNRYGTTLMGKLALVIAASSRREPIAG